jgi:hypothetical protein
MNVVLTLEGGAAGDRRPAAGVVEGELGGVVGPDHEPGGADGVTPIISCASCTTNNITPLWRSWIGTSGDVERA